MNLLNYDMKKIKKFKIIHIKNHHHTANIEKSDEHRK